MKFISMIFLTFALLFSEKSLANQKAIQDARSITLRSDGRYDVECIDGKIETRTLFEVQSNQICTHFIHENKKYELFEGGTIGGLKFCNFDSSINFVGSKLFNIDLTFQAPCVNATARFMCQSNSECSSTIDGEEHSLTYNTGMITLHNRGLNVEGIFLEQGSQEFTNYLKFVTKSDSYSTYLVPVVYIPSQAYAGWQPICYPHDGDSNPNSVNNLARAICADFKSKPFQTFKVPRDLFQTNDFVERVCYGDESSFNECSPIYSYCSADAYFSVTCSD